MGELEAGKWRTRAFRGVPGSCLARRPPPTTSAYLHGDIDAGARLWYNRGQGWGTRHQPQRGRKPQGARPMSTATDVIAEAIEAGIQAEEEAKVPKTMAKTLAAARKTYEPTVSYAGRPSADNGDDLATMLRGLSPTEVIGLAERILALPAGELAAKYEKLNPGQQRMNAGNRIRGAVKRKDLTTDQVRQAL